jgi:hypothetical protein
MGKRISAAVFGGFHPAALSWLPKTQLIASRKSQKRAVKETTSD